MTAPGRGVQVTGTVSGVQLGPYVTGLSTRVPQQ